MKSLNTVQEIIKVMHIVFKVFFIFTIVTGALMLAAGSIMLTIAPLLPMGLIEMFVSDTEGLLSDGNTYIGIFTLSSAILTAGTSIVLGFVTRYFKNELADGTPFTHRGANEVLWLGIISFGVPLVADMLSGIVFGVGIKLAGLSDITAFTLEAPVSGREGFYPLLLVFASFIFHYGADLIESKQGAPNDITQL